MAKKAATKRDEVAWGIRLPKDLARHVEAQVRYLRVKKSEVIRDALIMYLQLASHGWDFKRCSSLYELHQATASNVNQEPGNFSNELNTALLFPPKAKRDEVLD